MADVLLCSDLDRTLLPNGPQPESPRARALLRLLAQRPELTLAYLTGRPKALLREAIRDYELPEPDYAIGDVGTTIHEVRSGGWHAWEDWAREIAPDWAGQGRAELAALFGDLSALRLQEPEKQNRFKLSYYVSPGLDYRALMAEMDARLIGHGVQASLIWSVDETQSLGLLDVLPRRATKMHAVQFLMARNGFDEANTVFAGDSGNDLPVLTSGLQAVLVANATGDVRAQALRAARENGFARRLYLATGGFMGMNGNYAAGVLEGLVHFIPRTRDWMANEGAAAKKSSGD